ncbi:RING finger protein 44 like protein [Argiope bruennichi]|uniref:RING-type E3 ubiquitin transferase n=1 Tax=Argiope bruennichi TaxID=94029 RepID=A0A8T0EZ74_ARGBR|nr:RING finger protein 44 like protein [Argiope bruennichi]
MMKSVQKRKHSPVVSDENSASSVLTETDPEKQKLDSLKKVKEGEVSTIVQDANASSDNPSRDNSTNYLCCICIESVPRKKMKCLSCSHAFHKICINKWLKKRRRCPLCREKIMYHSNKK